MDHWTQKILAHLHDPPEKPYDFGQWHVDRAAHYSSLLGLDQKLWEGKSPDWTAAAADRMIFPKASPTRSFSHGTAFFHPLSGEKLELNYPDDKDTAAKLLSDAFPAYEGDLSEAERFFLLWRCWLPSAASQPGGESIPYLPADTRIADGSIWNHNSVVSALEGTRASDGKLKPALLILQIGPVQDFIAQARSTRDLWSGSYLLSWLTAHALQALSQQLGPDSVIFPALRGQALFDFLNRDLLKKAVYRQQNGESKSFWETLGPVTRLKDALVPNLPNRLLAVVPESFDPSVIQEAVEKEWRNIANACLEFLEEKAPLGDDARKLWERQVGTFPQVTWHLHPWQSANETIEALRKTGSKTCGILDALRAAAGAIPKDHQDTRCYPLNSGCFWSGHYALTNHRLDARRNCRDFQAWESHGPARDKDALSGKEETLIDNTWLANARKNDAIRHLFRSSDRLGAINLIKRVWHLAVIGQNGLTTRETAFDSVYAVAAGKWKAEMVRKLDTPAVWEAFQAFAQAACNAERYQTVMRRIPVMRRIHEEIQEQTWLEKLDAELLTAAGWIPEDHPHDVPLPEPVQAVQRTLATFLKAAKTKEPSAYYAVIAVDGDQVGEWLSGARNPKIRELLSDNATQYFEGPDFAGNPAGKTWLDSPRPLSPSFHLGLSEALSNFGLHAAGRVVEAHHGQLIYSGGDDVLAMVPAEEALACVEGLRQAFQGDLCLAETYPDQFVKAPAQGMIRLKTDANGSAPSWPLLVPGSMTLSAGIAIGHCKAPLQDMVEEAQAAEKRAKAKPEKGGLGRNAPAVSLIKRSGEILHWGANFGSAGLALLRQFQDLNRNGAIPQKFGHRVPELLARFDPIGKEKVHSDLLGVLEAEIRWAWNQLEGGNRTQRGTASEEFFEELRSYLEELAQIQAPIHRLSHLFAVETFLKRQAT
jgi:CRISPR-associated protein Cmr2